MNDCIYPPDVYRDDVDPDDVEHTDEQSSRSGSSAGEFLDSREGMKAHSFTEPTPGRLFGPDRQRSCRCGSKSSAADRFL